MDDPVAPPLLRLLPLELKPSPSMLSEMEPTTIVPLHSKIPMVRIKPLLLVALLS